MLRRRLRINMAGRKLVTHRAGIHSACRGTAFAQQSAQHAVRRAEPILQKSDQLRAPGWRIRRRE